MSKPYDATLKAMLETSPADWPRFLGVTATSVELLDADVSTVTAATDKVLRLRSAEGDRIQHLDFQAGPDAAIPRRAHGYSALLEERHQLPVDTAVILLSRRANLTAINGLYQRSLPGESEPYLRFRYRVIRVWELPVEPLLQGGVGLLPLSPISAVPRRELPGVIARMKQRLEQETTPVAGAELWTATKLLMGLCYEPALVNLLLQGVMTMKESSTYREIVEEGIVKGEQQGRLGEARRMLVRIGTSHFKAAPREAEQAALDAILDVEKFEEMGDRMLQCRSWAELLGIAETPPRSRKKRS